MVKTIDLINLRNRLDELIHAKWTFENVIYLLDLIIEESEKDDKEREINGT